MDLQYFFKILLRRKWLLVFVMIVATALAYYLEGLRPPTYKSKTIVETGIINQPSIDLTQSNAYVQQFVIESNFNNLVQSFLNRTSLKLLTYELLLHDLLAERDNEIPFRQLKIEDDSPIPRYSEEEITLITNLMESKQDSILTADFEPFEEAMIKNLSVQYGYDGESLKEKIEVKRTGETDYISVEAQSENPKLAAYTINTLVDKFIENRRFQLTKKEDNSVNFYDNLAQEKKDELDQINLDISKYKQNKSIVDLSEQSKITLSQIKLLELERESENQKINGLQKAISGIDKYIDKDKLNTSNDYAKGIYLNEDVRDLKEKITVLRNESISKGKKDAALEKEIVKQRNRFSDKIKSLANERSHAERKDKKPTDPENLLNRRIETEVELVLSEEGVKSLDTEIGRLRGKASSYVSAEAYLENLQGDKEIVLSEYLLYKEKLDEAKRAASGFDVPLSVLEKGQVPERPEPSMRTVIAAFAGIAAISLCVLIIFILTVFDDSLSSPNKFEQFTGVPLVGVLNQIKNKELDLQQLFDHEQKDKRLEIFKESLRKLRFKIENSGANSFLFTSTKEQEGKSFALVTLAYSLSLNNKKVLIIDTNFKNNTLTDMSNKTLLNNPLHNGYLPPEDAKQAKSLRTSFALNGNVDIIGNRGGNHSPSEILAGKNFRLVLQGLATKYDYIFLEAASLNEYSDARELVDYVDKVITVFDSTSNLNQKDKESISYLNSLNGKFMGGVLNNINLKNLN